MIPAPPPPTGVGVLLTAGLGAHGVAGLGDGAAALEASGASALWFADHLFWGGPSPDPMVASGLAAATTRACTIGTGVLQLPLHHTASVAKAATTVALAAGGRFVLGVGVGEHPEEFARAGRSFTDRGRRTDEALHELRRTWDADGAGDGDDDGWYRQRPGPPPIPIWVGGRSEPALRRVARHGDGWFPLFVRPDRYQAANARLDELLAQTGRSPDTVARAVVAICSVGSDRRARGRALAWLGSTYRLPPATFERHLVSGSPDACREHIAAYHAAGATHVALLLAEEDPIVAFESLRLG